MKIDLDELDRLERAASTGPWRRSGLEVVDGQDSYIIDVYSGEEDANFISALRSAARYLIDEAREAAMMRMQIGSLTRIRDQFHRVEDAINDCRLNVTHEPEEIIAEWREVARVHGTVVEGPK